MKVWNPNRRHFEAAPPMPEFVGHWQIAADDPTTRAPSLVRRLAYAVLTRAHAVTSLILDAMTPQPIPGSSAPGWGGSATTPAPERPTSPDRLILPLSSGVKIKPNETVTISSRPQHVGFRPERIVIGDRPEHWIVNDIKVGRRSQLADEGDLPGEAFSAGSQADICLDVVPTAAKFTMKVTYVGPDPDGAVFICTALGVGAYSDASVAHRIYLPISSGVNILPTTTAQITAQPQDPFRPERIIIGGNPEAWVVNDIKVGNRSQFSQAGDVPGDLFTATTPDSFVGFETVQTAMNFTIYVTYIGNKEEGEPLVACVIGSVPALA